MRLNQQLTDLFSFETNQEMASQDQLPPTEQAGLTLALAHDPLGSRTGQSKGCTLLLDCRCSQRFLYHEGGPYGPIHIGFLFREPPIHMEPLGTRTPQQIST